MENPMIEEKKRPDFLKVLCILTFIGSGFGILFGILTIFMGSPEFIDAIITTLEDMGQDVDSIADAYKHAVGIGISNIILSILSLIGAIMMFELNKVGIFIYAIAQLTMVFVNSFFNGMASFPTFSLLFTLVWIGMYLANYKYMTK
jgi:hypothetical protein